MFLFVFFKSMPNLDLHNKIKKLKRDKKVSIKLWKMKEKETSQSI